MGYTVYQKSRFRFATADSNGPYTYVRTYVRTSPDDCTWEISTLSQWGAVRASPSLSLESERQALTIAFRVPSHPSFPPRTLLHFIPLLLFRRPPFYPADDVLEDTRPTWILRTFYEIIPRIPGEILSPPLPPLLPDRKLQQGRSSLLL